MARNVEQAGDTFYATVNILLEYVEDHVTPKTKAKLRENFDEFDNVIREFYYNTYNKIVAQRLYSEEFQRILNAHPGAYLEFQRKAGDVRYRKITKKRLYHMEYQFTHPAIRDHWHKSCFAKRPMKLKDLIDKMCEYDGTLFQEYSKITLFDCKHKKVYTVFNRR